MRLPASLCVACLMIVTVIESAGQETKTSEGKTDEPLQKLLKQFPDADANKDGVLTADEARDYRQKLQAQRASPEITPTIADGKYGPAERNVFDFYQARAAAPTPLVIYIHGGGFVGGNKAVAPGVARAFLDAGVSLASIHYRFVDGKDVLFPAPQQDGALAVQYLRNKARDLNIDPKRVACFGGSAGAGISMWIAFHDEMADPGNADPVKRESTRIQAVGAFGGQGTYDPIQIKELIGGRAWEHPSIFKVYGIRTAEEALHPSAVLQKLYDECSAITHLTKDDPPLYMVYNEPDGPLPADARPGQGIHHPNFGRQLKKKMDDLGIENIYVYTPDEKGRNVNLEMLQFFQKQFARVQNSGIKSNLPKFE